MKNSDELIRLRILLVDDEEDDYVITRDIISQFKGWKIDLEWVSNYNEGLKAIGRKQHDVYLLLIIVLTAAVVWNFYVKQLTTAVYRR